MEKKWKTYIGERHYYPLSFIDFQGKTNMRKKGALNQNREPDVTQG
jgi:hypothetical protein